jgi:transcriptional regulator with XRE-family HTH domain
MGTNQRVNPKRLAEKLRYIRASLNLTQEELLRRLDIEGLATQGKISEFESGKRVPSLLIVLQYARLAGVHVEDIIDDGTDLPGNIPGPVKHSSSARGRKR